MSYSLLCGSFVKKLFDSAENDEDRFDSQTREIVREQVYSHGKLVLKASHWSRYVEGTFVNMKNVVGNFVTRTGTIHGD